MLPLCARRALASSIKRTRRPCTALRTRPARCAIRPGRLKTLPPGFRCMDLRVRGPDFNLFMKDIARLAGWAVRRLAVKKPGAAINPEGRESQVPSTFCVCSLNLMCRESAMLTPLLRRMTLGPWSSRRCVGTRFIIGRIRVTPSRPLAGRTPRQTCKRTRDREAQGCLADDRDTHHKLRVCLKVTSHFL